MQRFRFHPAIARWFEDKFGSPTEPQELGWPAIQSGAHSLIAAPTGSGKTLAAFLASLDQLFRNGLKGQLRDETRVLYVSPLKALSNDIHKNLEEPLAGIREALQTLEGRDIPVRAEVRTGDTPAAKRQAIAKKPPHILVTTPESFYLLLTSESGRRTLSTVGTLIVDEIHAVVSNRRGSHLALSMERLAALVKRPLQRVGLSATQKPIEEVARFLVGAGPGHAPPPCAIIDAAHKRQLDLAIELPGSPLEAVMSLEVWAEVYHRLCELIAGHRTTLVFVNTRRLAERVTHQLCERLGKDKVTSHHGSLSAKLRLDAEHRLKGGELKALVATSSLELGIDIGSVDLVCQLGSTRSIATLLQRVGRAEHKRGGLPKGRLFPLTRDELVECLAAVRCVRRGELDRLQIPEKPLDVLAQQIVACAANEDWPEAKLFDLVRSAYPYRGLTRREFDEVVRMLADGYSTKRGRRGALIHHDAVNQRVRARRGARLVALTSGGAIPDNADYRVVLEPNETFIGTVNEDFAIESMAGDIFQLGNASWKILRINSGQVRVEDAHGQPPGIPFWLGEAPARTAELSRAVSDLREEVEKRIQEASPAHDARGCAREHAALGTETAAFSQTQPPFQAAGSGDVAADKDARTQLLPDSLRRCISRWLTAETGLSDSGALQLADYFSAGYQALGAIPSQRKIVLERFFDESGGMQLVIHAPFNARLNRAWGLALRKRFCRSFNFELQAAATDDAIVLSLGTQHSFPLEEVFRYLKSATVRELLVQALLDAPMFPIRWRWNATRALALPRQRGGRKVPAPLQRMESENLLAAVFPDQLACLENIAGDREIPDHPLVRQTIDDCLTEAMDIDGLVVLLNQIERGEVECIARDLPEPSPLAHEILNARPYAFLDDAPLEERRTRAVYTRRASQSSADTELGILDGAAIERVCEEAWPRAVNADEMHEALLLTGLMTAPEAARSSPQAAELLANLTSGKRAGRLEQPLRFWVAAERLRLVRALYPDCPIEPALIPTDSKEWEPAEALRELLRGRMEATGPATAADLAKFFQCSVAEIDTALRALEGEGFILRGKFRPGAKELEWCDRRLLARIHRLTINRLRAEIQPVSLAEFQRFLLAWQRVDAEHRVEGPDGAAAVLDLLDGYELAAAAWEPELLALRVKEYAPQWLDQLCFTGRFGWGRLTPPQGPRTRAFSPLRSSPISLFTRGNLRHWLALAAGPTPDGFSPDTDLVLKTLAEAGALFFHEIQQRTRLLPSCLEQSLGELAAHGWVTADSFEGLRALLMPADKRAPFTEVERRRRHRSVTSVEFAGRWSLLRSALPSGSADEEKDRSTRPRGFKNGAGTASSPSNLSKLLQEDKSSLPHFAHVVESALAARPHEESVEAFARVLLRRYGIVFRRMLERESLKISWFELGRVYRRLEARGEIRGGHFISGVSGEQFALPEAIGLLRSLRKTKPGGELIVLSAADPLNFVGILTPGPRIPSLATNRILLRDGLPVAALEAGRIIGLAPDSAQPDRVAEHALKIGTLPAALRPYYA